MHPFRLVSQPRILFYYGSTSGSTSGGFARSRFRISMPSFANTAISIIAAHLVHSNAGSADALSQNGFMFSGFFENPAGCAMSYR